MSERIITGAMIKAIMKPGKSYSARSLAETFGIATPTMRHILSAAVGECVIESRLGNGVRYYELPAEVAPPPATTPLTISREMRAAQERCGELRVHQSKY
jgi:hypothetical protein